jgi:hypothetical protein
VLAKTTPEMKAEKQSKNEKYDKLDKPAEHLPKDGYETFFIARKILIRAMAFIYFIAFLIAYNQNTYLIGSNGLLPGNNFLSKIDNPDSSKISKFLAEPSLFWFIDYQNQFDNYLP